VTSLSNKAVTKSKQKLGVCFCKCCQWWWRRFCLMWSQYFAVVDILLLQVMSAIWDINVGSAALWVAWSRWFCHLVQRSQA